MDTGMDTAAVRNMLAQFPDYMTSAEWARAQLAFCYREGILNGSSDGNGNLVYRPDDSMTRQEFAAAIVRFLGVDASAYSDVTLPFADADQISSWALNDMKAAYSLGLITGSGSGGISVAPMSSRPASTSSRIWAEP